MKTKDMLGKSAEELRKELEGLRREQFNLRMQQATGQLGKPHLLRAVRRNIARVKTVMTQKTGAA